MLPRNSKETEKVSPEFQLSFTIHQAERTLSSWELVSLEKLLNQNNIYPKRSTKNQEPQCSLEEHEAIILNIIKY